MKVLSLLQPWASLCLTIDEKGKALKQIETRSWKTSYRGELLIHASAKKIRLKDGMYDLIDHMERTGFIRDYEKLPYGAIIGKVNLDSTFQITTEFGCPDNVLWKNKRWDLTEQELAFGDYSPNRYGWLLSDPILFDKPIPAKGKLGLWEFDMGKHIEDEYNEWYNKENGFKS